MLMNSTADATLSRQIEVETPEQVAVGFELADLGSRFTALLLDGLILFAVLLVLWIGIPLGVAVGSGMMIGGLPRTLIGWGLAALVLLSFALLWGYFVYFEGLRDGQTPGKKKLRIRVTHDGGYPLSLRGAMVRNLLRVVDIQPIPSWLVGGTVMLLHPQTKRLGDLAAGSVVVRERRVAQLPEESAGVSGAAGPPRLADEEFRALSGYIARRGDLKGEVRSRISGGLAARFGDRAGWNPQHESADVYLVALHRDEAARRATAGSAGVAGSAQATALVRRQRERWDELRRLVDRAGQRRLHQLSEEEVARFATLYRETSADLARARTYGGSPDLVYTLERLVGSGHNLLYRPTGRSWKAFRHWLVAGFPATVRRRWAPIAIAAALLYGPALFAFVAIRLNPPSAREFLPAGMIVRAEEGAAREAQGQGYVEIPPVFMPVMATGIIANNVQVTFVAFAGGIFAGLGTVLALVFNGAFLGAVSALFANHGLGLYLWSFVLPHGVIELTAICIAGGAGLWMGSAFLLPGQSTRRDALVRRGREAVSLIGGTTVLLLAAGLIEGFISPAPIPRGVKLLFAAFFAAALALYLLAGGRKADSEPRGERRPAG